METIREFTLENITPHSVNIVVKEFVMVDYVKTQLGATKRVCYGNTPKGRDEVQASLPEAYQTAILAIWDTTEPTPDPEPEQADSAESADSAEQDTDGTDPDA
ncbi:MAG: hypothetical protein ACI4UO_02900 [Paludibacteraceae bacterium]